MSSPGKSENESAKPEQEQANKETESSRSISDESKDHPRSGSPTRETDSSQHRTGRTKDKTSTTKKVGLEHPDNSSSSCGSSPKETKCIASGISHLTLSGQSLEAPAKSDFPSSHSKSDESELTGKIEFNRLSTEVIGSNENLLKEPANRPPIQSSDLHKQSEQADKLETGDLSSKSQGSRQKLRRSFPLDGPSSSNAALGTDELKSEGDQLPPKLQTTRQRLHSSSKLDPFGADRRTPSPRRTASVEDGNRRPLRRSRREERVNLPDLFRGHEPFLPPLANAEIARAHDMRREIANYFDNQKGQPLDNANVKNNEFTQLQNRNFAPLYIPAPYAAPRIEEKGCPDSKGEESRKENISKPSVNEEEPMDTSSDSE